MFTLIIVVFTVIVSLIAFSNESLMSRMLFWPYAIAKGREYHRFISNGFIHADIVHLAFNMIALFSFGSYVEYEFMQEWPGMGRFLYVLFYLTAIPLSCIWDYYRNKSNSSYRALGASGAVSAVIFAAVLFHPLGEMSFYFIPMRNFVFAPLFIILSYYMSKRNAGNIAHMVHLMGALYGLLFPLALKPSLAISFINDIQTYFR